jgi:signal transduction histidine kinase
VTAVRDDDQRRLLSDLRAFALYLATVDRRAAAATAVTHVLHELGNPTAALLSNLRFIGDVLAQLDDAIDERAVDARRLLGELHGAVDDAVLGARELVARIDRFRLAIDEPAAPHGGASESADLSRVVDATWALLAPPGIAPVRLERQLPSTLPHVGAPAERVAAILLQLLLNSLESSATSIAVTATTDGARVVLTVDDDGAGVPAEVRPRLAHPLVSTKLGAARGLGLALARARLEAVGGELQLLHPTSGGTSVRVVLPAVR